MNIRVHHQKNASKFLEVYILLRLQRMLDEKWNDVLQQVLLAPHSIGHSVAVILADHAASEKRLKSMENLHIALVLYDGEFRKNLKFSCHFLVGVNSHVETTFTVHEARNPLSIKLHRRHPNVKSLRVPVTDRSSLRIVPMSIGFLLPEIQASTKWFWRSFPHMVRFY